MRKSLTAVALVALTAAAATTVAADESAPREVEKVVRFHHTIDGEVLPGGDLATMEGDRVKIEDLATLLPGETRSYATESGREVLVTRGEGERYTVEVEGKKIELGGDREELLAAHAAAAGGGERRMIVRREGGEGEAAAAGAPVEKDVVVIREHTALATTEEGGEPPVIIEIVDEAEGKTERRVIVLRLDEPAAD